MTQSIIVYQNPGQEAIWNLLMGPFGMWLTLFVLSIVAGGVMFMVLEHQVMKFARRNNKIAIYLRKTTLIGYISFVFALIVFGALAYPVW